VVHSETFHARDCRHSRSDPLLAHFALVRANQRPQRSDRRFIAPLALAAVAIALSAMYASPRWPLR
jgi:hypothetical protein